MSEPLSMSPEEMQRKLAEIEQLKAKIGEMLQGQRAELVFNVLANMLAISILQSKEPLTTYAMATISIGKVLELHSGQVTTVLSNAGISDEEEEPLDERTDQPTH